MASWIIVLIILLFIISYFNGNGMDLWELLRRYVWNPILGRIISVLGTISTVWTLIISANPNITNNIPQPFPFPIPTNPEFWYGLTIAFLIIIIWIILNKASQDKNKTKNARYIDLVYDEQTYRLCREKEDNSETIRIGFRVFNITYLMNPTVIPLVLYQFTTLRYIPSYPIDNLPLSPTNPSQIINMGETPEYWVDLFKHPINSNEVQICYSNNKKYSLSLVIRKWYKLQIQGRAHPSRPQIMFLYFKIDERNNLIVKTYNREKYYD